MSSIYQYAPITTHGQKLELFLYIIIIIIIIIIITRTSSNQSPISGRHPDAHPCGVLPQRGSTSMFKWFQLNPARSKYKNSVLSCGWMHLLNTPCSVTQCRAPQVNAPTHVFTGLDLIVGVNNGGREITHWMAIVQSKWPTVRRATHLICIKFTKVQLLSPALQRASSIHPHLSHPHAIYATCVNASKKICGENCVYAKALLPL